MKAMRFAVIRFMPHVQTREFANIGIIATCPKTAYFDYKIETRYQRLSHFFQHFNADIYRTSIAGYSQMLSNIKNNLHHASPDEYRALLDRLTVPLETIIQTSQVYASMCHNEADELNRLFHYYVYHNFAKEQPETIFTRQIADIIKSLPTNYPFREMKLGNDEYHVNLPLVQSPNNHQISKIIKPIYLGQKDPAEMYQKADKWIARFKRLKSFDFIQRETKIMLPYQPPECSDDKQSNALKHIIQDLQQQGICTAHHQEIKIIQEFVV